MATVDNARARMIELLGSIGRAGLHSLYPDDFEYYACALEITTSDDEIVDTLVFPVMPDSITASPAVINTIKKTQTGVVSLFNPTFAPFPINISGTFGRKLRLLSNNGIVVFNAIKTSFKKEPLQGYESQPFNVEVKTGYGVIKALEKIVIRSTSLDSNNKPYRVYFYNMALNHSHLVEGLRVNFHMDRNSNMLWNYNLSMTAIAPAFATHSNTKSSIINTLSSSVINQGLEMLMDDFSNIYGSRVNNLRLN